MAKTRKEGRVSCTSEGCPEIEVIDSFDRLSYTAAFVDCDGSFSMVKETNYPSLYIYNNNIELLRYLKEFLGGAENTEHRNSSRVYFSGAKKVVPIIDRLLPRLITKKEQAETLREACMLEPERRTALNEKLVILNGDTLIQPPPDTPSLKIQTTNVASDWSYFGGFLDTDADVTLVCQKFKGVKYFYPRIQLHCKQYATLKWIQDRFGGQLTSRKRSDKVSWISALQFQDQTHIEKILIAARPHVVDKKILIDMILSALKKESTERESDAAMVKAFTHRFNGRRHFVKNPDGTYTDSTRSLTRPHKTHKGKPLPPVPPVVHDEETEEEVA